MLAARATVDGILLASHGYVAALQCDKVLSCQPLREFDPSSGLFVSRASTVGLGCITYHCIMTHDIHYD